jgi:predicted small secreted protein
MQAVLTRRAALLSFGAFTAAGLSGCNTTPGAGVQPGAASGPGIGAIEVDTTPLVAYVGNPTAGWAQQALPGALAQALGSGAPGGPTLHVRIDTLYLGGGNSADPDRMRGVATLAGHTISVRGVSTNYISSPTDQALPEQALQGRVQQLAIAFAYRLKSKLGA